MLFDNILSLLIMNQVKDILVNEFIEKQREHLEDIEEKLRIEPLSFQNKINLLQGILIKGIKFGVEKGVFLENVRIERIKSFKKRNLDRFVDDLVFNLNNQIAQHLNQPKIKYSKKKYRDRKKPHQLTLWAAFGFEE